MPLKLPLTPNRWDRISPRQYGRRTVSSRQPTNLATSPAFSSRFGRPSDSYAAVSSATRLSTPSGTHSPHACSRTATTSDRAGAPRPRGRQHDDGCTRTGSIAVRSACAVLSTDSDVGERGWPRTVASNQGPRACGSTGDIVDLQEVGRSKVVARCPSLAASARVQRGGWRPMTFTIRAME
jgi:hypothetical protein